MLNREAILLKLLESVVILQNLSSHFKSPSCKLGHSLLPLGIKKNICVLVVTSLSLSMCVSVKLYGCLFC